MSSFRIFLCPVLLLILWDCANKPKPTISKKSKQPDIYYSNDKINMTVIVSSGTTGPFSSETPPSLSPGSLLSNMLTSILDDSLRVAVRSIILSALPPKALDYKLQDAKISAQSSILYYAVDTASIRKIVKPIITGIPIPGAFKPHCFLTTKQLSPPLKNYI